MIYPSPTYRWHVGFVPAPKVGLWKLGRGSFGHCMAFRYTGEVWLLVEHNAWGLEVRTIDNVAAERLVRLCHENGSLLAVDPRRRDFRWLPPPGLTCVTATAALLGVRRWVFTPKQLYRELLRQGAKPLMEKSA